MSFSTQDETLQSGQLNNISDHVERYKRYLSKLKTGKSSGISGTFGRAEDLLPADAFEQPAEIPPVALGENVFSGGSFDPSIARQALESLIEEHALAAPEVVAVYEQNGRRCYLLADDSVVDEEELAAVLRANGQQEPVEEATAIADTSPTQTGNVLQDVAALMSELFSSEANTPAVPRAVAENRPDVRVCAPNGLWLWDVYYDNRCAYAIDLSDGSLIQRAHNSTKYVFAKPVPGQRLPQLEILDQVVVDPIRGNIFCMQDEGAHAIAFLNNGWQIDQHVNAIMGDAFYVTEPLNPGDIHRKRERVYDLEMDAANGEVAYATADGAKVVLNTRPL